MIRRSLEVNWERQKDFLVQLATLEDSFGRKIKWSMSLDTSHILLPIHLPWTQSPDSLIWHNSMKMSP